MNTFENSLASNRKLRDDVTGVDTARHSARATDWWRLLRKRWIPAAAVAATVFAGVALYTLTKTHNYRSETLILLEDKSSIPVSTNKDIDPSYYNDSFGYKDYSTEVQILKSTPLVAKALSQLDPSYKNLSVGQLSANLTISQVDESDVLIVSYTDTDPQRAQAVLEVLGSTYVNYSLEKQRSQATNAIQFIEEQLPKAKQELSTSALRIKDFRKRHGIVDPESQAASVSGVRSSLSEKAYEAKANLDQTKRQYQELRRQMAEVGQDPGTALADSVLSQDGNYQKLVDQLGEAEAKYAQASIRLQETHPQVQDLKASRNKILGLLQSQTQRIVGKKASQFTTKTSASGAIQQELAGQLLEVQTNLAVQSTQLASIQQAQAQVAKRFQQVPELQQTYTELQRQLNLNSKVVDSFLEKRQELRIKEAQETSPWRVLEPPYLPTSPVAPNVQRSLFLALAAGCLLGIGAAILLERLDERVKGVEEVKELTDLPLLGAIPKVDLSELAPSDGATGLFKHRSFLPLTESLRSLALNLRYLGSSGNMKTLAFTSAIPAEGKTTVTYYLALVLAELGRRVLIIDADMRIPSLHRLSQLPNTFGLSTAIATDRPWGELVHTDHSEKLDVMTSGPIPPNPVALLGSEKMTQLLQEWRQVYDFVLIDTPPIVGMTDAQSLAPRVDGMILVAGIERSTRSAIARALEILQRNQANVAGLVVNLLNKEHGDYYYYQYYSSYYGEPTSTNGHNNQSSAPKQEALTNFFRRR
jgi:capsular exopolysaccharide synthesis family protein